MSEDLIIIEGDKKEQYESLLPQIKAFIAAETDGIANMANVAAALKEQFNWLWVGFYLVKNDELIVGPFQGPVACTRIQKGKGVCGNSWSQEKTIIVPDVQKFDGHIACSSHSQSEIVVPLFKSNEVVAVLDADAEELNIFDETDAYYLEQVAQLLAIKM